ncbi:MAG: CocE/NonD family hydrolase, partial [Chloroflexi bacterium]|nr:CocE/NonD family hydrolase [Chloroflexota bacterium]
MTILFDRDVPVSMRDGTVLRADVVRDGQAGPAPALLLRTPYLKEGAFGSVFAPFDAVARGYAVVIQDCRGTGESEGELHPFLQEVDDGYDTVEWCAAQEWCDGRVGMYGMSYMGATPWLAAIAAPPSLRAIATFMTGSDFLEGWTYEGGAFHLGFNTGWVAANLSLRVLERSGVDRAEYEAREVEAMRALARLRATGSFTPLDQLPLYREVAPAPYYFDWLARPDRDEEWEAVNIAAQAHHVEVPALGVGGWYDLFAGGPPQTFNAVRERGATEAARDGQRLLMGPWNHSLPALRTIGAVDFGPEADVDLAERTLRWFDWQLFDRDPPAELGAPVRYFTMGPNSWRESDSWPPPEATPTSFFLRGGGAANGAGGDGRLEREPGGDEPPDEFLYHPLRPVPTVGGGGRVDGAFDQRRVEERQDVLGYDKAPHAEPREVSGPLTVELHVA